MEWLCVPPPTDAEAVLNEMRKLVKQSDTFVKTYDGSVKSWLERWRISRMRGRFDNLREAIKRFHLDEDQHRRYYATLSEFKSAQVCINMLNGDYNESEECLFIE